MQLNVNLSDRVKARIGDLQAIDPSYGGLTEALAICVAEVGDIAETRSTAILGVIKPDALGNSRTRGIAQLLHHIEQMLLLLHHIAACRLVELTRGVFSALDDYKYSHACLLARALVEHAAIAQWRRKELVPQLNRLNTLDTREIARRLRDQTQLMELIELVLPLIGLLDKCYGAGRFNRGALTRFDELVPIEMERDHEYRQIGVMDAVDACEWDGPLWPATTPRFYYELLSDYVHPNSGANILYVDREEITEVVDIVSGARNKVIRRVTAPRPGDDSLLLHVLAMLCIPVRESLRLLSENLKWMQNEAQKRTAQMNELSNRGIVPILSEGSARVAHGDLC